MGWRNDTTAGAQELAFNTSVTPSVTSYYAVYSRTATFYYGLSKASNTTATQYYTTNNSYSVTTPTVTSNLNNG